MEFDRERNTPSPHKNDEAGKGRQSKERAEIRKRRPQATEQDPEG